MVNLAGIESDQFWDLNQTWNTQVPQFSSCFEDTVLASLPCLLYCLILCLHLFLLPRPVSPNPLPWTWLNVSKMFFSFWLLMISCVWCGVAIHGTYFDQNLPYSSVLSSCSRVVTFFLVLLTMWRHRTVGITTSTVLSTFWIVLFLCSILLYRSAFVKGFVIGSEKLQEQILF
ncbi:multidrug resistance-associated protein 1 [Caerostris extrusa]|uniref:Multidrug resistance-associated protein 1 n=1 Tax=Caerostris extrusa TaxID=172846 RepID=A0AAV4PXR3_CAEEX|nr:multidrug resistance-associated protein 1 [Caerostris extrusa]